MYIYGRNPVKEAYIAGKTVDKIFVQKGEFDPDAFARSETCKRGTHRCKLR